MYAFRFATFRGKHNKRKALCLLILSNYPKGLTQYQLSYCCPGTAETEKKAMESLRVLLSKWCGWGIVYFRETKQGKCYHISRKGMKWLNHNLMFMPYSDWYNEMPENLRPYFNRSYTIWKRLVGYQESE